MLERDAGRLYPDLSEVGIGVALVDGQAAVRLLTEHPFAEGFEVRTDQHTHQIGLANPHWVLDPSVGEHTAYVAALTRYGKLTPKGLLYKVQ